MIRISILFKYISDLKVFFTINISCGWLLNVLVCVVCVNCMPRTTFSHSLHSQIRFVQSGFWFGHLNEINKCYKNGKSVILHLCSKIPSHLCKPDNTAWSPQIVMAVGLVLHYQVCLNYIQCIVITSIIICCICII